MKVKNINVLKAFLERDAQDYSSPEQIDIARERNEIIINKIKGKENGTLIVYIYSNLGITMATLRLEMGKPSNYSRLIHLGSNPNEYNITKVERNSSVNCGIKDMVNL